MFGLSEQTRVFLKTGATDGRLGLDALRGMVSREDAKAFLLQYLLPFTKVTDQQSFHENEADITTK